MKITFCVTYYNQQEFVEQSINSILAIDIPCDFEILVGDDGSTDKTLEQVQKLQKLHPDKIKYFTMSRDNSVKYNPIYRVTANRLNLVENATGDYLMFLDGDDFYCDKTFIIDALNQFKKDSKLIAVAFNYQKYFPNKNMIEVPKQKCKTGKLDIKKYIKKCWYTHSGAIVFKNIIDKQKLKFLKSSEIFDDNVITIYMFQYGNVYYIDRPIYSYRQVPNSIWTSKSEIERCIETAMFYEYLPSIVPYFKYTLSKRRYFVIKKVYKKRKNLKEMLGINNYEKYFDENKKLGNKFICDLLCWNELTVLSKFFIVLNFWKMKTFSL